MYIKVEISEEWERSVLLCRTDSESHATLDMVFTAGLLGRSLGSHDALLFPSSDKLNVDNEPINLRTPSD